MSEPTVNLRNPTWAAFLAWLVPGLGHFYQGRTGKGILYAVCILGLYFIGMLMGEGKIVYWRWVNPLNNPEKFCLYYLGQFFVGLPHSPLSSRVRSIITAGIRSCGVSWPSPRKTA